MQYNGMDTGWMIKQLHTCVFCYNCRIGISKRLQKIKIPKQIFTEYTEAISNSVWWKEITPKVHKYFDIAIFTIYFYSETAPSVPPCSHTALGVILLNVLASPCSMIRACFSVRYRFKSFSHYSRYRFSYLFCNTSSYSVRLHIFDVNALMY